jgi:3-deoxy-D-manno-octulosonate 8-phosphate phosphatase (KDO 8-P phosphatase)
MKLTHRQLHARARKIKLLLMDVDGVLTDGRIYYLPAPDARQRRRLAPDPRPVFETKTFHSRDGLGIRLAQQAGLRIGIVSGRKSPVVEYRAHELDFDFIEQHALEKLEPYHKVLRAAQVRDDEVCYMGDDIVDLPILTRVGLAVAVADGHPLLEKHVHYVTRAHGGLGAVREAIELILTAQGKFDAVLDHYLGKQ